MTPAARWDPSTPGFIPAALRAVLGLAAVVSLASAILYPAHLWGVLAGGLLAVGLLLAAYQAGRVFAATGRLAPTMAWLLAQQVLLWAGMALCFLVWRVSPAGFAVGVSSLPVGILSALGWYLWKGRGERS